MSGFRHSAILTVAAALTGCAKQPAAEPPADLVFTNGGIYTVDAERSWAQALAVRDGIIVAVGDHQDMAALIGAGTRVIDLDGGMALPGFHDAHVHTLWGGRMLLGCSVADIYELEPMLAKIRECVANAKDEWIVGENWDLGVFPQGNPHKSLLDKIAPDRPIFMRGSDGHSAWLNSRALELAGIDADTPTPEFGVIERDPETGEPTGTLRETAVELVVPLLPQATDADRRVELKTGVDELNRFGITSFIAAMVDERELRAYRALATASELNARVVTSIVFGVNPYDYAEASMPLLERRSEFASERVNTNSVKLFADFVLEGETAALLEPYVGMGEHRGRLNFEPAALTDAVKRFDAMGLQIHFHVIGDRAARVSLDALEAAREANGSSNGRHHISHLQLIHPDDIPRFAPLDVSANFQALWAWPDDWITGINLPVVGQERVDRMYPIGSVARAGGRIVGGSDWFVSSPNPLWAIETAIRRQNPIIDEDAVLNAAERVDLATMIDAYTINGAWLMHQEDEVGSLEVGKRADLVVQARNLFDLPPRQISDVPVLMTVLDGEVIYETDPNGLAMLDTHRALPRHRH
jgi:predicted amidohydrolase YtcJ